MTVIFLTPVGLVKPTTHTTRAKPVPVRVWSGTKGDRKNYIYRYILSATQIKYIKSTMNSLFLFKFWGFVTNIRFGMMPVVEEEAATREFRP